VYGYILVEVIRFVNINLNGFLFLLLMHNE